MFFILLSFLICIGIPVMGGIYFAWKRKGTFLAFLLGILSFSISQLVIRIPLLSFLGDHFSWFSFLPYLNPILYYAILALSAGIFEESGRLIGLSCLRKKQISWLQGLAFGLGHGGVEAVWIAWQGLIPSLFDHTLFLFPDQALFVGLERLCTMSFHIALTMVVLKGIWKNRKLLYWILAVFLHAAADFSIVTQNPVIIWSVLIFSSVLSLLYLVRTKHSF